MREVWASNLARPPCDELFKPSFVQFGAEFAVIFLGLMPLAGFYLIKLQTTIICSFQTVIFKEILVSAHPPLLYGLKIWCCSAASTEVLVDNRVVYYLQLNRVNFI
ncbi:hypothetical protein SUGI_0297060 [Cryptomeria japonica]|nr:hypothetical protein SUGI_0297060 [Cryptomeria japonica]